MVADDRDRAWLGVDVGGTFTDAVLVTVGALHAAKHLTTVDQSQGVLLAVADVLAAARVHGGGRGVRPARFAHGTTVATNALLERRGVRTAGMFTAACFDLLELARQDRPRLYDLLEPRPAPLVASRDVVAVRERMGAVEVLEPLAPDALDDALDELSRLDVGAVAICLLHSWRDPSHEHRLAQAVRARFPNLHVVASYELSRELREYERASTAVVDATLTPVLAPYLDRLGAASTGRGLPRPLVMQSSGSLGELGDVAAHAVRAVLSGPAGGVVAARSLLDQVGVEGVVCVDVGGTSCDVASVAVDDEARARTRELAGHPIQLDMVDVHTMGAGGSSIAWVDPAGALRVGPQSAGSQPGPASYGRGGTHFTVTDAHLLLGHLQASTMRHWGVDLDRDSARRAAIALGVGDELQVASAVVRIATANMAEAARVVSVARGHDPGSLALLAFGGAGGLHACDVAAQLGSWHVLVPAAAGVLSAFGLAVADVARERTRTVALFHDADDAVDVTTELRSWVTQAVDELRTVVSRHGTPVVELVQQVRHAGQSHTLDVRQPLADAVGLAQVLAQGVAIFRDEHVEQFGYVLRDTPVETVTLRVEARVPGPLVQLHVPQGSARAAGEQRTVDVATAGRSCVAIDLPGGTCLVPDPWQLRGVRAGCLDIVRGVA